MADRERLQAEKMSVEARKREVAAQAGTTLKCVRARQVEEMHGKDIRTSEELKSQKQKQSQYQKSMDQTLNAKMISNTTLSSTNSG